MFRRLRSNGNWNKVTSPPTLTQKDAWVIANPEEYCRIAPEVLS